MQTLRAICLVDGQHDELVLRHFFGRELARERVLNVPVRGVRNVNAINDPLQEDRAASVDQDGSKEAGTPDAG